MNFFPPYDYLIHAVSNQKWKWEKASKKVDPDQPCNSQIIAHPYHFNVFAVTEPVSTSLFRSMFSVISGTESGRSVRTTSTHLGGEGGGVASGK